jgi:hypothetical protein
VGNFTSTEGSSDIVERLRDPMIDLGYGDRLTAAEEIERLRAEIKGLKAEANRNHVRGIIPRRRRRR